MDVRPDLSTAPVAAELLVLTKALAHGSKFKSSEACVVEVEVKRVDSFYENYGYGGPGDSLFHQQVLAGRAHWQATTGFAPTQTFRVLWTALKHCSTLRRLVLVR